ncbi:hypothetical protein [Bacillus haikouensis]|nr:hypothetical protein [Bacillus haikouensis]
MTVSFISGGSPTALGKRVPGAEINGPYSMDDPHSVEDFVA